VKAIIKVNIVMVVEVPDYQPERLLQVGHDLHRTACGGNVAQTEDGDTLVGYPEAKWIQDNAVVEVFHE
jgi:hypothetical protein